MDGRYLGTSRALANNEEDLVDDGLVVDGALLRSKELYETFRIVMIR